MENEFIKISDAAQLAGVTTETIRSLCKSGVLSYIIVGNHHRPSLSDVQSYAEKIREVHNISSEIDDYIEELNARKKQLKDEIALVTRNTENYPAFIGRVSRAIEFAEDVAKSYGDSISDKELSLVVRVLQTGSLYDVGKEMNLSRERCRQIWYKTLRKIAFYKNEIQKRDDTINELKEKISLLEAENYNLIQELDSEKKGEKYIPGVGSFSDADIKIANILNRSIFDIDEFSVRTLNCLKYNECERIIDVVKMSRLSLLRMRNFGKKSLMEIDEFLEANCLWYEMDVEKYKYIHV